ncbi:uncharacterized protein [Amphiura filiformis]|uniref:uncharacterized protein n=1 Tax=Amphiura filiformis TaxID=82378 RepID=UPI003B21E41C
MTVFTGNKDSESLIRIDLSPEIEATAIRIHPKKSFVQPCLRIEIIGCAAGVKRCEVDHLASCDFQRVCTDQTGLIASLGHPGKYPQRSSCTWNIITDQGSYIYLSFINFDIPSLGECDSTSVIVYNGDTENEESEIDHFCNDRRPPDTILSDYNHILVVLQSGAEDAGSGFIANYAQHRVNSTIAPGDRCQEGWSYFKGSCYVVVDNANTLSWFNAEEMCQEEGAHLVSIRDEQDMDFVHSLIINSLQDHVTPPLNIFIGLKLNQEEWSQRWTDGRPMSYTDWHTPIDDEGWTERQPDGGILELCVRIVMRNFHSTNHWHDIPCVSRNEAGQYICMKQLTDVISNRAFGNLSREGSCPDNLIKCTNGECRHRTLACDTRSVCLPEEECEAKEAMTYLSTILQGQCRQQEYQCARSGECISVSFLCDFKKHCADGSDEEECDYPSCTGDEFQCANGQCISASSRCDLIVDCLSGSDEDMCTDSSVGFQCYDGRWLPAHAQCDGQRDCAGKNWEDETAECGIYQFNFTCGAGLMTCNNGACVEETQRCLYGKDKYGFPLGCRDATHLQDCDIYCPSGTLRCPGSYCIPIENRCDDVIDCPNGEDEAGCDDILCPGYYRCQGYRKCLELSQLCDDVKQCPDGDDELFCDVSCPPGCSCSGLTLICIGTTWNQDAAKLIPDSMRQITLVGVAAMDTVSGDEEQTIGSRLFLELSSMKFLITLNISENFIAQIDKDTFDGTINLRILYLAHNLVSSITNGTFIHLSRLRYLDLSANPLTYIEPGAFLNLNSLNYLNMQDTKLRDTTENTFSPLVALSIFYSDNYLYCCLIKNLESITECLPEPDQFSSCADLMRNDVLRVFMWILGTSALFGNTFVFYERVRSSGQSRLRDIARVQNFMVGNLAVADGIMGIYMLIIASADVNYRDRYAYHAEEWQKALFVR